MYNIKAVSKILDMPTVTIRAWETRYNAITPERNESGHRVYTEEHLNDLKWLKQQVQNNELTISQAVRQLKAKKKNRLVMPFEADNHRFEKQIGDLLEAVADLDAGKCNYLLDLYFSQFHYKAVFHSIIVPLMYKVGTAWEKGELHVANEHMISNLVMQRFMKILSVFDESPSLPRVMAICPEGEYHQLGLIFFTLFLREKHYPVLYIGADTPLNGLSDVIKNKNIEIIALSTSRPEDDGTVEKYITTLREQNPRLKFIIGGLGVQKSKASEFRWDVTPKDGDWEQALSDVL